MSIVGIVGSEGAKFTPATEQHARLFIRELIDGFEEVCSGGCHLGGIDIWAKEEAEDAGKPFHEWLPLNKGWTNGYKERNKLIAETSDIVYCITVRTLPATYTGITFDLCYHCGTKDHVKSGGCWTVKYAKKIGKQGEVIVIE